MKKLILSLSAGAVLLSGFADDFTPVKKKVRMEKREITVSIIGEDLMALPEKSVEQMIAYWKEAMDREIANRPDLVVLPEICDTWRWAPKDERYHQWLALRGSRILNAFRECARQHHCYLIYPTYRPLGNRRYANSSILIDRDGDVIAVYDNVYPTVREMQFGVVPGRNPVIAETDFGRLGMVICFDLNFWDLMEAYAKLKPDVLAFSSYYDGGFMRQTWAAKCRSWLIGATVGELPKTLVGPASEIVRHEHSYYRTVTVRLNTNCAVVHLDFNRKRMQAAIQKYGPVIGFRDPGGAGMVTFFSRDPKLPIGQVIREFGIETWDQYYERSRTDRIRHLNPEK